MRRRSLLAACCAPGLCLTATAAAAQDGKAVWQPPERFSRPGLDTDEGGLWAMMDREETRLRRSPFMLRDAALRDYLQGIACKLAGGHCADVRVYPVRTPFFNASMAPNGMMQVWTGLLLRVDNEAQLAAVMGHEIGHFLQRHTLERLRDVKSRSAFASVMGLFGIVGLVGTLAALAGMFSFSRDQERDADTIGLQLMRNAGYDPREAAKIWANLSAELAAAHGGPAKSSVLFASHPGSDERASSLAQLTSGDSGGFVGEAEYGSRLQSLQVAMLDDELRRAQPGETLVLLERLIARSPLRADLLYYRGEARRNRSQNDDVDQAMTDYARAIELGQEPPQVHRAMGYVYRSREQEELARAAFGRYVERAPEAADVALIKSFL